MKIIVERSNDENQTPIVTIDTKTCHYPYAIRNAIELALELDGYSKETIREVFGIMPDVVNCEQTDVIKKITESYSRKELHNELAMDIRNFVSNMAEFETSPFIVLPKENQRGFGILSDNGYGNVMKRFTVIIEDHKCF